MSKEIQKFQDPGLPEHVHRKSDVDPKAADRAERQVAILFVLSALSTFLAIYAYIFIKDDIFFFLPIMGSTNAHQLFLGLGMAFSLLFIGLGMAHWAKNLMPDTEVIAERHEFRSPDEDREDFVRTVKEQAGAAGLGRRSLIKRTLGLALGAPLFVGVALGAGAAVSIAIKVVFERFGGVIIKTAPRPPTVPPAIKSALFI